MDYIIKDIPIPKAFAHMIPHFLEKYIGKEYTKDKTSFYIENAGLVDSYFYMYLFRLCVTKNINGTNLVFHTQQYLSQGLIEDEYVDLVEFLFELIEEAS
jgi:hypothetical protein